MAYMAQQAVTTTIRDAFRKREDALDQAAEAARCRAWLERLPLSATVLATVVEPIVAIEDGLREAARLQRLDDAR